MSFVISDIKNPYPLNVPPSGAISTWTYLADIRNISNMYPYGKSYPAVATYSADDDYRYGFNGMEKAKEVDENTNYTHFRNLDLDLGRCWSRDPLESSMPYQSPYVSMDRNPILYTDFKGDSVKLYGTDNQKSNFISAGNSSSNEVEFYSINDDLQYKIIEDFVGPLSPGNQLLMNAIDDPNVNVGMYFTEKNSVKMKNGEFKFFAVGAYQGSYFDGKKVKTYQAINNNHMNRANLENIISKEKIFKHEIIESYLGGLNMYLLNIAFGNGGTSSNLSTKDFEIWHELTKKILSQPDDARINYWKDSRGLGVGLLYDGKYTFYLYYDKDMKPTEEESFKIHEK